MDERLKHLEKQVATFAASFQVATGLVVFWSAFRLVANLGRRGYVDGIFNDMLDGAQLPWETQIVITHGQLLVALTVLVAGLSIAFLAIFRRSRWTVPFGLSACFVFLYANQFVLEAYFKPIIQVIRQLTG